MGVDDFVAQVKQAVVSGHDLVTAFSSGESAAGQFRIKWLRRLLLTWWWIAAVIMAIMLLADFVVFIKALSAYTHTDTRGFAPDNLLLAYAGSFAGVNFLFDLWAGSGLGYLGYVWQLRERGSRKAVKAWTVVLAAALVFGRLTGFWWSFLFAFIPTFGWFFFLWPVKYILLPPVALVLGGAAELLTFYFAVMAAVLALVVLPVKIFEAAFGISNSLFMVKATKSPFFSQMLAFWYWFTGRTLPSGEDMPDESKGARFATLKEMVELHSSALQARDGAVFGHVDGEPFRLCTDKHVLLTASTRSGKGVSLIIPHLLRYEGSAFVLDPKGENAKATYRRRSTLNDKVFVLDPFGITGLRQARYNPLSRFTPDNMEAESKALAAALVMGESGRRDHWTASGQQLLASLILYVYAAPDFRPEEKDLPTVRRLLLSSINETLQAMAVCDVADGLVADLAASFLKTPETERGNIISTAQRETEVLDNPFIVKCLSASGQGEDVDFKAWRTGTMTVYLCLSAPKFPVFNRWLRLVLTSALDEMTDMLEPPPLPVCFMLDELAALGHLAPVENAVGLAAGYGIQLWSVFQDVAQMKDLYKGRWASFIGNAGIRALFNLDDYDTAKYWSNFLGGHLVETASQQQDIYGLTKGQSKSETMRPLLSPEDIMLQFAGKRKVNGRPVEPEMMLVLPQGSRPLITERVAYFDDAELNGLWDDPRRPVLGAKAKSAGKQHQVNPEAAKKTGAKQEIDPRISETFAELEKNGVKCTHNAATGRITVLVPQGSKLVERAFDKKFDFLLWGLDFLKELFDNKNKK